jgi:hypothetical protein
MKSNMKTNKTLKPGMKHGKKEEAAEMKGMSPKQMKAHMKSAEERAEYRKGGKVKGKGC